LLKMLVEIDGESMTYLRKLSQVYEKMELYSEQKSIESILLPLEEDALRYANAYQEVLEVLKYVPEESVKKIPSQMLSMMISKANMSHGFRVDTELPFEQQSISEETKAIFANIYRDYWANDKQRKKIKEKEDRDRLEMKVELLREVLASADCDWFSPEAFMSSKRSSVIYNEVNWVLSNLPRNLTKYIPLSVLAVAANRELSCYKVKLGLRKDNKYQEETLPVVKYLISKYVPDRIVKRVIESVSEDIDLTIIFDKPDYQDN
ncbi:MAG: hypothetical protein IKF42_00545, partial [Mogibacterium sp.]|nr:hypothetical protein [Mogibacterium sp.]